MSSPPGLEAGSEFSLNMIWLPTIVVVRDGLTIEYSSSDILVGDIKSSLRYFSVSGLLGGVELEAELRCWITAGGATL